MHQRHPVRSRHRFHGDPARFEVVADWVGRRFQGRVRYVADVAGGQGMLFRLLAKRYGFECEVVDPRGWTLKGVASRPELFTAEMADYYDLVIGLHPDGALPEVVRSAAIRPVVVVPCCNFWTDDEKLGRDALLEAIEDEHRRGSITSERVEFSFKGPYRLGLVSEPSPGGPDRRP